MVRLLKDSFGFYKERFGAVLAISLPVFLIGVPIFFFWEVSIIMNFDPSRVVPSILLLPVMAIIFIWSHVSLVQLFQERDKEPLEIYRRGWERLLPSLGRFISLPFSGKRRITNWWKLIKNLFLLFVIWFPLNWGIAIFVEYSDLVRSVLLREVLFCSLNFLVLFPLFNIYLSFLYQEIKTVSKKV